MIFPALFKQWFSGDLLQLEHPCPITSQWVDLHIRHIDDDSTTSTRRSPFQRARAWSEKGHLGVCGAHRCAESDLSAVLGPDEQRCVDWLTIFRRGVPEQIERRLSFCYVRENRDEPNVGVDGVILKFPGDTLIDGFAIDFEPWSHLTKTLFEDGNDLAVGCRTDVD